MKGKANAAKQRTIQQNRALHLYFQFLADELNNAGLDMRKTLKPHVEIAWSKDTVKEYLWRPIQKIQLVKKSTTQLSTTDIDKVFDTLNMFMARKGIHVPFPSVDALMERMKVTKVWTLKK